MLDAVGAKSLSDLFRSIPAGLRLDRPLELPPALDEISLLAEFRRLAARNETRHPPFVGAGCYPHHVPPAVDQLLLRGEFFTAYTPYQAEISQGTLQALFEWQTFVCLLSGLGVADALPEAAAIARRAGALTVSVTAEAVSLGLLQAPGALGADVAVGTFQSFGNPMTFGGPAPGFFATREAHLRQMPGRIAGATQDRYGRRGFVLTLSTREQHIRREKATSNVCTNSGLCALAATIHLSLLGRKGLAELARLNHARARMLRGAMERAGFAPVFSGPVFNE